MGRVNVKSSSKAKEKVNVNNWSIEEVVFLANLLKVVTVSHEEVRSWSSATNYQNRLKIRRKLEAFQLSQDLSTVDVFLLTDKENSNHVVSLGLVDLRGRKLFLRPALGSLIILILFYINIYLFVALLSR